MRLIAPRGDDAVRIEHTADAVEEKIMRAACRWQRVHRLDAQTVGIVPERDQCAHERIMTRHRPLVLAGDLAVVHQADVAVHAAL